MVSGQELIVTDGGMGHLLRRNGVETKGEIGTCERFLNVTLANSKQPDLVVKSHMEYLEAGAQVIITNNYACTPAVLEFANGSVELQVSLIDAAGRLARDACDEFCMANPDAPRPKVAGCLPPLHESYRPDKVGGDEELIEGYDLIVKHIAPHSDILICETMSTVNEGKCAAEAAARSGLPVWLAWTLADDSSGLLRSGETIEEAVAAVAKCTQIKAMMFNCSSPVAITAAMPLLQAVVPEGVAIGAYANGFTSLKNAPCVLHHTASDGEDSEHHTSTDGEDSSDHSSEHHHSGECKCTCDANLIDVQLTPEAYTDYARSWMKNGATIVGGCCGVFPEHIREMTRALHK